MKEEVDDNVLESDDKEEVDELEAWLQDQEKLKRRMRRVCAEWGDSVRMRVKRNQFMYDRVHDLLFCRNAKVGTTTWLTNFLLISDKKDLYLNGDITSRVIHTQVPPMFPLNTDPRLMMDKTVSFSIVRHPWVRLVSAFQDKMLDNHDNFYKSIHDHLKTEYGAVTFNNFVEMIIDQSEEICRTPNRCRLDKHWKPFLSRCGYCDLEYQVIARMENFVQDQEMIGRLANVTFQKIESHKSSGGSTEDLTRQYFADLDKDMKKKLYNIFKIDFDLFGYDPNQY